MSQKSASQSELEVKRKDLNRRLTDYVLKHHPWVRWDLVQQVLDDPATDEAKRVQILALRHAANEIQKPQD